MSKIREFLEAQAAFLARHADSPDQPNFAKFMLTHGQDWRITDASFKGRRGKPNNCYENTVRLVERKPWLTYCEGYIDVVIPLQHAWAVTDDRQVIDPTLAPNKKHDFGYVKPQGYFGIPFKREFIGRAMRETETYGILHGMSALSIRVITGEIRPEEFLATDFVEAMS